MNICYPGKVSKWDESSAGAMYLQRLRRAGPDDWISQTQVFSAQAPIILHASIVFHFKVFCLILPVVP